MLLSLNAAAARSQATPGASQRVRVRFYGMASYVRPSYVDSPRGFGVSAGSNLDGLRVLPYFDLGLDLRAAISHAEVINESFLSGGPRVSYNRYRVQPYAEYMFGVGRGGFNLSTDPNYKHDYTAIRSLGGGLDYGLTRDFSVRADAQYQRWRFTYVAPYFHPVQVSVGVTYRFHPHSRTGPRD